MRLTPALLGGLSLALALGAYGPARGQGAAPVPKQYDSAKLSAGMNYCRWVQPDRARLNCYDGLAGVGELPPAAKTAAARGEPPPSAQPVELALADVKVDKAKLIGHAVTTAGHFMMLGDIAMLSDGAMDTSPLQLAIGQLDRETRKALMGCGAGGCTVKVTGVMGRGVLGVELVLTGAEVR